MDFAALDRVLREAAEDLRLDADEKQELRELGQRLDAAPAHMHHKFALFDGRLLANDSFNWTRSATRDNDENLVVTDDANLVRTFGLQFERLWGRFA